MQGIIGEALCTIMPEKLVDIRNASFSGLLVFIFRHIPMEFVVPVAVSGPFPGIFYELQFDTGTADFFHIDVSASDFDNSYFSGLLLDAG